MLVGDEKQLGPTVKDGNEMFHQSLFQRLIMTGRFQMCLLNVQHRMHPEIFQFPNRVFYNNKVTTELTENRYRKWHDQYSNYQFFLHSGVCQSDGTNITNTREAFLINQFVTHLYQYLGVEVRLFD